LQLIHSHKIIVFSILFLTVFNLSAQKKKKSNGGEIDPLRYKRPFHMGFSITGDYAKFKLSPAENILFKDSLLSIRTQGFPGFGLGGITNLRLGNYFDLRALPQLHFNQRNLIYTFRDRVDEIQVESVSFDLPILIKYKSERHNNKRLYLIAGVRPSHDFMAREDKQRGPFIRRVAMKKQSLSYEFGFGMDIYTYMFKFSPEIKMTNTITNMISPDQYIYNGSIGLLQSRLFQISLHFE
jgi:hypothetical protein